MKYLLVVQFPQTMLTYDQAIELEDIYITLLEDIAIVDGHDIGNNEINYFIMTDNVEEVCNKIISSHNEKEKAVIKIAYRSVNDEEYEVMYPAGCKDMVIT